MTHHYQGKLMASLVVSGQLQYGFFFSNMAGWAQLAIHNRALMHFKGFIRHLTCDIGLGLQFQQL